MSATGKSADIPENVGAIEKFNILNESVMHMGSNPAMPWGILLLGIWIPTF